LSIYFRLRDYWKLSSFSNWNSWTCGKY